MQVAEESIQQRAVLYDKEGDYHYDTISAFIKSLRGSDPDAAMYWLAKMVYAGEDPRFLFRRMLIFASEDVGLADPHAVTVTLSCATAFDRVGLPEGRFPLAQAALYLATAPKSNSIFAFFDALGVIENEREGDVPTHLKDASRDAKQFGHGEGYLYPHAYRDHWVAQQYLPTHMQGKVFYEPGDLGYEQAIRHQVVGHREAQLEAMLDVDDGAAGEVFTYSDAGARPRPLAAAHGQPRRGAPWRLARPRAGRRGPAAPQPGAGRQRQHRPADLGSPAARPRRRRLVADARRPQCRGGAATGGAVAGVATPAAAGRRRLGTTGAAQGVRRWGGAVRCSGGS